MIRTTFGGFELVSLTNLTGQEVLAKVDTGAWSGAIHSTDIYEKDGLLHYKLLGDTEHELTTTDYELRVVKSSNGIEEKRYLVPIEFEVRGNKYSTTITLNDRGMMQYEMLIGRKMLLDNDIIVDVSLTAEHDLHREEDE